MNVISVILRTPKTIWAGMVLFITLTAISMFYKGASTVVGSAIGLNSISISGVVLMAVGSGILIFIGYLLRRVPEMASMLSLFSGEEDSRLTKVAKSLGRKVSMPWKRSSANPGTMEPGEVWGLTEAFDEDGTSRVLILGRNWENENLVSIIVLDEGLSCSGKILDLDRSALGSYINQVSANVMEAVRNTINTGEEVDYRSINASL